MKSWAQLSFLSIFINLFFFNSEENPPHFEILLFGSIWLFEDLEKIPFLAESQGPAIKNEVVASSIQAFFEESQADIATQYEVLRAVISMSFS